MATTSNYDQKTGKLTPVKTEKQVDKKIKSKSPGLKDIPRSGSYRQYGYY